MVDQTLIRNFSIIAHIDHGKSTLADRFLVASGAISERDMREQFLDDMELEREMGITIKANRATIDYSTGGRNYMLNLLDTPGHVDFHYEVSRSLAACEGVLLLVDAAQGAQAQTIANAYLAIESDKVIIPVINKIDLPTAHPEEVALELEHALGLPAEEAIFVSAKTGEGLSQLYEAIIERIPPPRGADSAPLRGLVYDAKPDPHRGVIVHLRIIDGVVRVGEKVDFMGVGRSYQVTELGKYRPKAAPVKALSAGEVGFLIGSIKNLADVNIGDTITLSTRPTEEPLAGYKAPQQMVFCDFYPGPDTQTDELREALEKLWLNDCSFTHHPATSDALGIGFRCGFLGLLHMRIIQERLERESDINVVQTAPTVTFEVSKTNGEVVHIESPSELPETTQIREIREPMVTANIVIPAEYIGNLMKLAMDRRGVQKRQEYLSATRVVMTYTFPLAEIIYDFYDKLKSITKGYGTMDYELIGFQSGDLAKLDILVNSVAVDALSVVVHRHKAESRGRRLIERLRKQIARHQFEIPIQAAIGGKIIARETIRAFRKDVTAKCYGGDVTRKRKLLEKQKAGKKRMKTVGRVEIPQEAFMSVLDPGD